MTTSSTGTTGTADQTAANGAAADTNANGQQTDTRTAGADQQQKTADGTGADPFAELVKDADTREWLGKRNIKDVESLGKTAREQASLLGSAIRVPGKDATDDERNEFLNKLGRPPEAKAYDFQVPKDLPEDLPYDAERASRLKELAWKTGLSQSQAAALHDAYIADFVDAYKGQKTTEAEKLAATATKETEALVKLLGPLDGAQAKATFAFADKALNVRPEAKQSLKDRGLIGPNNEILDHQLALLFADLGMAVYKEDDVLHGSADRIGNPFADGSFNLTSAMQAWKEDETHARSLIAAAGKKPSDFGLSD